MSKKGKRVGLIKETLVSMIDYFLEKVLTVNMKYERLKGDLIRIYWVYNFNSK